MRLSVKKYLGIDFGDRRVGLALAEQGSMAAPYKVVERKNDKQLINDIKTVVESEAVDIIVVGLPISMSGRESQRTEITKQFIDLLKENFDLPVESIDERLSSKLFEKQGINKDLDKFSAAAILDSYLDAHGR